MSTRAIGGIVVLIVALVGTRFIGLHERVLHHDEMVHAWFADRLATSGEFQASPVYHGPLLYHLEAGVIRVFGSGTWRVVPAAAGVLAAVLIVLLARRESGSAAAVAVAGLVVLSPSWLYYSRFNAHDTLILLMTAILAWGRWHWEHGSPRVAVWLMVTALACAWSTKLNALFILGAIALWPMVRRLAARGTAALPRLRRLPRRPLMAATLTAAAIVTALFATTFVAHLAARGTAPDALLATLDAAFVDPVRYWARSHYEQRLGGPFHFYAAILFFYEPLVVVGTAAALLGAWRSRRRPVADAMLLLTVGVVLAALSSAYPVIVRQAFHTYPVHLTVLPLLLAAFWTRLRDRGRAGDDAGAWWTWMAAAQGLLYGYAGEKMPWLTVHVALPLFMLSSPALARLWSGAASSRRLWTRRGALLGLAALTLHGGVAVTTWNRSNVAEPLVQLEYSPEAQQMLARAGEVCALSSLDRDVCLVTTADALWPAQWHLRRFPKDAVAGTLDAAQATSLFVFAPAGGPLASAMRDRLAATHDPMRVRFGTWGLWTQWLSRPHLQELLEFWIRRQSLGPRRGVPYELWVRHDLLPRWRGLEAR